VNSMRWATGVFAAATLAAAGCGGTTAQVGSGASSIVPASAPAFIAFDTNASSSQWQTIDALAAKFPDKQKAVDQIKKEMSKDGVSWDTDVKPALGDELDVVWLDFANDGQNFVVLLQPKNEAKFKDVIAKENKSDPSTKVVYEKFRGWEVASSTQATIDRFKQASNAQAQSLADVKQFKQSMDRLGKDAVMRAYVNGPFLMDLARKFGGAQVRPYLNKAGKLDWIAMRLGANSDGVGFDAIVHGSPGKLFKGSPAGGAFTPKLIGKVPKNALVYFAFHGTKNMFASLKSNPIFGQPGYRQFAKPLQDVGRVLEGENALFVRPGNAHASGVPFAIPEVTLVSTPQADGTKIIDGIVKRFGGTLPQADTVDGTPVHAIASHGVGLYYGTVDGKFVVTDQPGGIRGVKGGTSLSDDPNFKTTKAASGLPDKTYGFLYFNISSSIPYGEKLAQHRIPAEIAQNVKPLRSAVEYVVSHSHEAQLTLFLRIK